MTDYKTLLFDFPSKYHIILRFYFKTEFFNSLTDKQQDLLLSKIINLQEINFYGNFNSILIWNPEKYFCHFP